MYAPSLGRRPSSSCKQRVKGAARDTSRPCAAHVTSGVGRAPSFGPCFSGTTVCDPGSSYPSVRADTPQWRKLFLLILDAWRSPAEGPAAPSRVRTVVRKWFDKAVETDSRTVVQLRHHAPCRPSSWASVPGPAYIAAVWEDGPDWWTALSSSHTAPGAARHVCWSQVMDRRTSWWYPTSTT